MKKYLITSLLLTFLLIIQVSQVKGQSTNTDKMNTEKLVVLWTSGDPYVADRVALMYTHAAKKNNWFNEVILIIWGPSAKLASENIEIQKKLKSMKDDGVTIKACIACATAYNVTDKLKDLGFEVIGMGLPLSNYLKDNSYKVLTF